MPECCDAKLLRCSPVRLGRTVSSISFSRNTASYSPRPRLRSQTTAGGEGRIDLTDIPYVAPANDNSRVKDKSQLAAERSFAV